MIKYKILNDHVCCILLLRKGYSIFNINEKSNRIGKFYDKTLLFSSNVLNFRIVL